MATTLDPEVPLPPLAPERLAGLLDASDQDRQHGEHARGATEAREAVLLARTIGAQPELARGLGLLGTHELRLGSNEACIGTLQEAIELFEELEDPIGLSGALNAQALAYHELGLDHEALDVVTRSLAAAKRSGDTLTIAWAYNRTGVVEGALGDHEKGGELLELALRLAREAGDEEALFAALNNLVEEATQLALAHLGEGETERAEATIEQAVGYAEDALALARTSGSFHREAIILLNLGGALGLAGKTDRALELLRESTALSRRGGFRGLLLGSHQAMADAILRKGDVDEAIQCYRTALLEAEHAGDLHVELALHRSLSVAYKQASDFEQALEHYELFHGLERRLRTNAAETRARLLAARIGLDRAESDAQQAALEAEVERARSDELLAEKVELEQEAVKLLRGAHEDGLTGLWNRRHVERELPVLIEDARRREEPLSLALVDADNFKSVNDRFGHLTGDDVLRRLADVLRTSVRPGDLVARLGGEEFLVALPGAAPDAALALSERLCEAVRKVDWGDLPEGCGPTVSVGVTTITLASEEARSPERTAAAVAGLLASADEALYVAKRNGRDRVEVGTSSPG
jgi:diguanylate cyclase (GGDEF)-like protein